MRILIACGLSAALGALGGVCVCYARVQRWKASADRWLSELSETRVDLARANVQRGFACLKAFQNGFALGTDYKYRPPLDGPTYYVKSIDELTREHIKDIEI